VNCWYHSTPSKLCDACMREQAKAAPAVSDWADMGDAPEVHSSAAIDFAMLDFSGDVKLSAVEALCGFAARMATPVYEEVRAAVRALTCPHEILYPDLEKLDREVSDATDALRYALDNPGPDAKPFHQVMADWLPSKTPGATFFGVERTESAVRDAVAAKRSALQAMEYHEACRAIVGVLIDKNGEATPLRHEDVERHETFRLGARGCHVGATVRHRGDPLSGLMTVTAINSVVDRVCCVDANGDKREFGLSGGWLVLVNGSGR
jgi:hypothetical protein